jgi:hypothetical protein
MFFAWLDIHLPGRTILIASANNSSECCTKERCRSKCFDKPSRIFYLLIVGLCAAGFGVAFATSEYSDCICKLKAAESIHPLNPSKR